MVSLFPLGDAKDHGMGLSLEVADEKDVRSAGDMSRLAESPVATVFIVRLIVVRQFGEALIVSRTATPINSL